MLNAMGIVCSGTQPCAFQGATRICSYVLQCGVGRDQMGHLGLASAAAQRWWESRPAAADLQQLHASPPKRRTDAGTAPWKVNTRCHETSEEQTVLCVYSHQPGPHQHRFPAHGQECVHLPATEMLLMFCGASWSQPKLPCYRCGCKCPCTRGAAKATHALATRPTGISAGHLNLQGPRQGVLIGEHLFSSCDKQYLKV